MRRAKLTTALLMPLTLMACVTINVYFPAAAAEKAADKVIQRVWGDQQSKPPTAPGETPAQPPAPAAQPAPTSSIGDAFAHVARATLEWLVPPAEAAGVNFNVDTPAIRSLEASMRERFAQLAPFYSSGAVGLTRDALITVRDNAKVGLRDRNRVAQLVADENRDREALYREIANANGHPEWVSQIRRTFAERWVSNAHSGWWYQDADGGWRQK